MSFIKLDKNIKTSYDSDVDDLLKDFYIQVLNHTKKYYRLTGAFSSTILAGAARGISGLIKNNGKIKLVCWSRLQEKDYKAIKRNYGSSSEILNNFLSRNFEIDQIKNKIVEDHLRALAWLLKEKRLEIKIAIKKKGEGIFHPKSGLLVDTEGNEICFFGSGNESISGWKNNIEQFHVYKSWHKDEYKYFKNVKNQINKLISNKAQKTEVYELPTAIKNKIIEIAPSNRKFVIDMELEKRLVNKIKEENINKSIISKSLKISPWKHQQKAIESLKENDYNGILKMATGTGKTLAALFLIDQIISIENGYRILVIVNNSDIKDQWYKMFLEKTTEDNLIYCNPGDNDFNDLINLWDIKTDKNIFLASTIQSINKFFDKIKRDPDILIADEVHNYGTENKIYKLNNHCSNIKYKIGLSATPERYYDKRGTKRLLEFFGDIVYKYNIKQAQKDKILAKYIYKVYIVNLTENEEKRLENYNNKIGKEVAIKKNHEIWEEDGNENKLKKLFMERANIIKNASNKVKALKRILKEENENINQCIVYFNRETQLESGAEIFKQVGIDSYIIYHGRIKNRDEALNIFKNKSVKYILSMKCLDEGVDIPSCDSLILSSCSKNPRKYIQRRGRVLRNPDGSVKTVKIFDILAFPNKYKPSYRSLIKSYLVRPWEFIDKSRTPYERKKLHEIMKEYDITAKELKEIIKGW